jgi:hypothetical protein
MTDHGSELSDAKVGTPLTWTDLGEAIRQLAGELVIGELGDDADRRGVYVEDLLGWLGESLATQASMN